MCVVNGWNMYRRDCEQLKIEKKDQLQLYEFKLLLARSLTMTGKTRISKSKRGRPPTSNEVDENYAKKKKFGHATKIIPTKDIRLDNVSHILIFNKMRGKCKYPGCSGKTNHFCLKCQVHLCCNNNRNCNQKFHE